MDNLKMVEYLEGALRKAKFIYSLDNELAKLSALNGLIGYLQGGLEVLKHVNKINKSEDTPND